MSDITTRFPVGETFALLAAVNWAFAVILFRRSGEHVHPLGLNLFKNLLAALLILPTLLLAGESLTHSAPARDWLTLLASGVLGLTLGDTFYFLALNALGAGLMSIVVCLYSPFIIGLSILWLGERLTAFQGLGAVLIVSAVLAVTQEGRARTHAERRALMTGIGWALLSLASTAVGIVGVKPVLERSPLFWATEVRLLGGILSLLLVLAFHPRRRAIVGSIHSPQRWRYTLGGSFMGTYVSMLCWLAGMKFAPASIAATLNQTSSIFMFLFGVRMLGEPVTRVRIAGVVCGVAGAILVLKG